MTQSQFAGLPFVELRDRLKACADLPLRSEDVDLGAALLYLNTLSTDVHTPESADAFLQLARNFRYAGQPANALEAASNGARLALLLEQKPLLRKARALEAEALCDLGEFAKSALAYVESWSLACGLGDEKGQLVAVLNFGVMCHRMGQWQVASRYYEQAGKLAEQCGLPVLALNALNNLAYCAVHLRQPAAGLRALSKFWGDEPQTKCAVQTIASAHHTLARLHLLASDIHAARTHAHESVRLSEGAGLGIMTLPNEAVLALIDMQSGQIETGLEALEGVLRSAKRVSHTDLPDFIDMCIDAYEYAGYPDRALEHLRELAEWKKNSLNAQVVSLRSEVLAEPIPFQSGHQLLGDGLLAKAHSLQIDTLQRVQRMAEMAVDAEIAAGHDLYRTFRVAKLARLLAADQGWSERRLSELSLGAQLCNVGMMAVPPQVLLKPGTLSNTERSIVRDHTRYGAELLRKSKLQILGVASVIAEQHHEHHDGGGYPRGLRGEAIAAEAQIVAICDVFDAMTHSRPCRNAPLSVQEALHALEQCRGSQFDRGLVDKFVDLIRTEFAKHRDFDSFLSDDADELQYVRARARMEAFVAGGAVVSERPYRKNKRLRGRK